MWVRGLKHGNSAKYNEHNKSHPMWVRGLKLVHRLVAKAFVCRTLCGCVD